MIYVCIYINNITYVFVSVCVSVWWYVIMRTDAQFYLSLSASLSTIFQNLVPNFFNLTFILELLNCVILC